MTEATQKLSDAGVSLWLDDLSRERLETGNLQELVETRNVVGVTTNPTIFAQALSRGDRYDAQMRRLAEEGRDVEESVFAVTTDDVREACDVLAPIYRQTRGQDGRVSIEVDPRLAVKGEETAEMARRLHRTVDRENVMIKIPATEEGLEPIAATLAEGISVNVTLIFSLERYRAVINAYLTGLERALEQGRDLSKIHSVASFFVSRVDSEVDARLEQIGTEQALALKGRAGLANARLAYQVFQEAFSSERWKLLAEAGAVVQRPLWASTGTKDPNLPDTLYVTNLVADGVVNTMPEKTMDAFGDHGELGEPINGKAAQGRAVLDEVTAAGVDLPEVFDALEAEGVDKFIVSWHELIASVEKAIASVK